MKEWQENLKPYLLSQTQNKWLNPENFKTLEEFHKAYVEERAKAIVYTSLIEEIENADNMIVEIKKQLELPDKKYEL